MPTSTLPAPARTGSRSKFRFKTILWAGLGLTTLFVFITSEVFLVAGYPMYHAYLLQVIADRQLLIPHVLAGTAALLIGPVQFSSRIRRRYLGLHRVLGRIYVISVFVGSFTGIALAAGRPGLPHNRRFSYCAQPSNRRTPSMDGPFLCRHIYICFQPCPQSLAPLLGPLRRLLSRRRRNRVHPRLPAYRRTRTQLAGAHHPSRVIVREETMRLSPRNLYSSDQLLPA
jgi:hypothetical protein